MNMWEGSGSLLARKSYGRRAIRALPPATLATHIEEAEQFFTVH